MSREPLSKKLRFEVFKRDGFACQYCGRKAPEVILHCDHIKPVADGGGNDILNLATSCIDCNSGKGARKLSDNATLTKQLDQLEELNERREQIEMMIEWRDHLSQLDSDVLERLAERYSKLTEGSFSLNVTGRDNLRKLIKKFGVDLVLRAMDEAAISYLKRGDDGKFTRESGEEFFSRIGGVARVLKDSEDRPHMRQLYYIRGILRRRLNYFNDWKAMKLMEEAVAYDIDLDWLEGFAKGARNWSQFRRTLQKFIAEQQEEDGQDQNDQA